MNKLIAGLIALILLTIISLFIAIIVLIFFIILYSSVEWVFSGTFIIHKNFEFYKRAFIFLTILIEFLLFFIIVGETFE